MRVRAAGPIDRMAGIIRLSRNAITLFPGACLLIRAICAYRSIFLPFFFVFRCLRSANICLFDRRFGDFQNFGMQAVVKLV